jgi:hypothetical protein
MDLKVLGLMTANLPYSCKICRHTLTDSSNVLSSLNEVERHKLHRAKLGWMND